MKSVTSSANNVACTSGEVTREYVINGDGNTGLRTVP